MRKTTATALLVLLVAFAPLCFSGTLDLHPGVEHHGEACTGTQIECYGDMFHAIDGHLTMYDSYTHTPVPDSFDTPDLLLVALLLLGFARVLAHARSSLRGIDVAPQHIEAISWIARHVRSPSLI